MMRERSAHPSDETLLLFAEAETPWRQRRRVREHLAACWSCRMRMSQLQEAVAEAARLDRELAPPLPPADGPRALLKARLREAAEANQRTAAGFHGNRALGAFALLAVMSGLLMVIWPGGSSSDTAAVPRYELTPGAVRAVAAKDVCTGGLSANAVVMPALESRVLAEYGVASTRRRAFEVDYLITPALGGSEDIRNLWPQPYAGSPWNAYVKDALEDRLQEMVCNGQLDLGTAQREIAMNWIAAYKKYFHTRQPLPQHQFRSE